MTAAPQNLEQECWRMHAASLVRRCAVNPCLSKYEDGTEHQRHARSETEMRLLQDHHDRDDREQPGVVLDTDLASERCEDAVHP